MSAYGYKRTYSGQLANVRFTPESGHSEVQERVGLKKQTLDVRFAPDSGRKWLWRWMSAYEHPAGNWKRESGIGLGFFGQGSIL